MAEQLTKSDTQAALDEVRDLHAVVHDGDGEDAAPFVTLGRGVTVQSLKPVLDTYRTVPERMKGTVRLNDLDSLAAYVNLYKRPETIIFVDDIDPSEPSVEVVLDAHSPNAPGIEGPGEAGWGEFRAAYDFPLSPEWLAWRGIAGAWLPQAQFAAFLEEHILEVGDPANPGQRSLELARDLGITLAGKSKLLELSRGLSITVNQKMVSEVKLSSGEGQVQFEEKHEGKGGEQLRIPRAFPVEIPVFRGDHTAFRILCMLNYRADGGSVKWQLAPHLLDRVFEEALKGASDQLRAATAVPVLRGRPVTL